MKNKKKKVKIKKKKRNTLLNSLQHPEPIIFDERMEAIDKRSYIWGVRIYTIIIFLTCLLAPIAYPDLRNNIFSTFLFGVVVFTVLLMHNILSQMMMILMVIKKNLVKQ